MSEGHEYDGCALSFGGGVNSTSLAILLVNEGWRGAIVFADTGCEIPETYSYMAMFERDWLAPRGLSITRLGAEWRGKSKGLTLLEFCEQKRIVPSVFQRWCTTEWKRRPLDRWQEAHGIIRPLVGIAADESHRARADMDCPLCDRLITRDQCKAIIAAEGLPVPPKSGCVMCFFQGLDQWRRLWERHPDIFERLCRLDDAMTARMGVEGRTKREYTLLKDRRGNSVHLRTLAAGFAAQDTLPGLADTCGLEYLRCWACMT